MNIAIIPARGGSKRIPRKNIKKFCGKPMISYAIEVAKNCGLFDHTIVSTDDVEIAQVAEELGAEIPFMRPAELADDYTATIPVIVHAIESCQIIGWKAEHVCCIYPAVPFIQTQDLQVAHDMLEQGETDYVFAITRFPSAIQRSLRQLPNGCMQPFYPEYVNMRTQDIEPAYYDAGQFYWGKTEAWINGISPHQAGEGLIIPEWRTVDIDTPEDWQRAELMSKILCEGKVGE